MFPSLTRQSCLHLWESKVVSEVVEVKVPQVVAGPRVAAMHTWAEAQARASIHLQLQASMPQSESSTQIFRSAHSIQT